MSIQCGGTPSVVLILTTAPEVCLPDVPLTPAAALHLLPLLFSASFGFHPEDLSSFCASGRVIPVFFVASLLLPDNDRHCPSCCHHLILLPSSPLYFPHFHLCLSLLPSSDFPSFSSTQSLVPAVAMPPLHHIYIDFLSLPSPSTLSVVLPYPPSRRLALLGHLRRRYCLTSPSLSCVTPCDLVLLETGSSTMTHLSRTVPSSSLLPMAEAQSQKGSWHAPSCPTITATPSWHGR